MTLLLLRSLPARGVSGTTRHLSVGTVGNMSFPVVILTANGLAGGYLELTSSSEYIIHPYYPLLESTDISL